MADEHVPATATPRSSCPICRRASDPAFHPFCSKRCADVDLHRWLTGTYAVPAGAVADDTASSDADDPDERP